MPRAGAEHGIVAFHIAALLQRHIAVHDAGRGFAAETGFVLARDPDTVRAPDAAFVSRERSERVGRVIGYWPGAPDLSVEVVSPEDAYSELHDKPLAWLAAGTQLVLVADPATRRVTLYRSPADVIVLEGATSPSTAPRRSPDSRRRHAHCSRELLRGWAQSWRETSLVDAGKP